MALGAMQGTPACDIMDRMAPLCLTCGAKPRRVSRRAPKLAHGRECTACHAKRRLPKQRKGYELDRLLAKYGISAREWEAMYQSQQGRCLICEAPLRNRVRHPKPDPSRGKTAAVDHRHDKKSGLPTRKTVRGLLCAYPCNRLLTKFWTVRKLVAAAMYLDTEPAQQVLRHAD